MEAYALYLRARQEFQKMTEESYEVALGLLKRAADRVGRMPSCSQQRPRSTICFTITGFGPHPRPSIKATNSQIRLWS